MERDQIDILHQLFRHVDRIVVTASIRSTIAGKMLYADHDTVWAEPRALESANLSARHRGTEKGIFSSSLHDPAPASVACKIDHGRESPLNARRTRIFGSYLLRLLFNRGIPRGSHGERNWKDRAVSMNDIEPEDNRNVE